MRESWRKVTDFPNYSVSNLGRVRDDKRCVIKVPTVTKDGYFKVDLYRDGKRYSKRIHRLVAKEFIKEIPNKDYVNHKDGNKTNNVSTNLEWVTNSENMLHAYRTGLAKPSRSMLGRKNPNAGRKGRPIRIVETGEVFGSIVECEKAIDGNNRHICDCLSGRQKTHRGYTFEYV
jgi:hypothetical protein